MNLMPSKFLPVKNVLSWCDWFFPKTTASINQNIQLQYLLIGTKGYKNYLNVIFLAPFLLVYLLSFIKLNLLNDLVVKDGI